LTFLQHLLTFANVDKNVHGVVQCIN